MSKIEIIWLSPTIGAFVGCISSVLVLAFFGSFGRLSEQRLRKIMTIAAIGGTIIGLLLALIFVVWK